MTKNDKRYHSRIDSLNLLSYLCIDETDQVVVQGMGRTLNVSEGGILLETHIQIDSEHTVMLTMGLEEELVDIKGKTIHSSPVEDDKFQSGIYFLEIDETALQILKKYIKAFKKQYSEIP